jgi:hypothetical protein
MMNHRCPSLHYTEIVQFLLIQMKGSRSDDTAAALSDLFAPVPGRQPLAAFALKTMPQRLAAALRLSSWREGTAETNVHHRACRGGSPGMLCALLPLTGAAAFIDRRDERGMH